MCVSVLFYWLLRLKPEVESRHRPAVGEICNESTVLEFCLHVLIAKQDAVLLPSTDG